MRAAMRFGQQAVVVSILLVSLTVFPVAGLTGVLPSTLAVSSDIQKEEFVREASVIGNLLYLLGRLDSAAKGEAGADADIQSVLQEINALRRQHNKEIFSLAYIPESKALILFSSKKGYVICRENDQALSDRSAPLKQLMTSALFPEEIYPGLVARTITVTDGFLAAVPAACIHTEYDAFDAYGLTADEMAMIRARSAENGFEVARIDLKPTDQEASKEISEAGDAASKDKIREIKKDIYEKKKREAKKRVLDALLKGKTVVLDGNFPDVRTVCYYLLDRGVEQKKLKNVFVLGKDLRNFDRYFPDYLSETIAGKNILCPFFGPDAPPLVYWNSREIIVDKDDQVFEKGTKVTAAVVQGSADALSKITFVNNTAWEEKELQESEEEIELQLKNNPTGVFVLKLKVDSIERSIKPQWRDALLKEARESDGWITVGVIFSPLFTADEPSQLPDKHEKVVKSHTPKGNSLVDPKVGILPQFQGLGLAPVIVGATKDYAQKMDLDNVWAYSRPSFLVRYVTECEMAIMLEKLKGELARQGVTEPAEVAKRYEGQLVKRNRDGLAARDEAFRSWFEEKAAQKKLDVRGRYILLRKEELRQASRTTYPFSLGAFFKGVKVPSVAREYLWVSAPGRVKNKVTGEPYAYEEFLALKDNEDKFTEGYIKYADRALDRKYYDEVMGSMQGHQAFLNWLRDETHGAGASEEYKNKCRSHYAILTDPQNTDNDVNIREVDGLFKDFLKKTGRKGYDLALRVLHSKAVPVLFVPGGRPDDYLESDGNNFIMEYLRTPSVDMIVNVMEDYPLHNEFSADIHGIPDRKFKRVVKEMMRRGFEIEEVSPGSAYRIINPIGVPIMPDIERKIKDLAVRIAADAQQAGRGEIVLDANAVLREIGITLPEVRVPRLRLVFKKYDAEAISRVLLELVLRNKLAARDRFLHASLAEQFLRKDAMRVEDRDYIVMTLPLLSGAQGTGFKDILKAVGTGLGFVIVSEKGIEETRRVLGSNCGLTGAEIDKLHIRCVSEEDKKNGEYTPAIIRFLNDKGARKEKMRFLIDEKSFEQGLFRKDNLKNFRYFIVGKECTIGQLITYVMSASDDELRTILARMGYDQKMIADLMPKGDIVPPSNETRFIMDRLNEVHTDAFDASA